MNAKILIMGLPGAGNALAKALSPALKAVVLNCDGVRDQTATSSTRVKTALTMRGKSGCCATASQAAAPAPFPTLFARHLKAATRRF